MEFYLAILIILLVLAAIDLTVGVANDAVNFLNSAIGAHAGKFKLVMGVAALGVIVGVLFSGGMMEIARKGVFNPQFFTMPDLMIIFVSIMFQDILLLDTFNTFGLPTSTTVSVVFGLFGGGVALAITRIFQSGQDLSVIFDYLNTNQLFTMITAILMSILFAFVFGALIQYLTRLLFTFNYKNRIKKYGAIWGGFALSTITLFLIVKGAKNATFIPSDITQWIENNTLYTYLSLWGFWIIALQLTILFTKANIIRFIVLFGTFGLAMSFAANDLVNFIGAPLAGLNAYQIATASDEPLTMMMGEMAKDIPVDMGYLLIAAAIMVITLFLSKKARTVTETTINLTRQEAGYERFESNVIARSIVRIVINFFKWINNFIPNKVKKSVNSRFDIKHYNPKPDEEGNLPAFDMLRAAVILTVSAGLISLATFFKLPLSTTYVTFIVAMAAALPDRAWGRESAVYRVSGVVTVVGGWFFTALAASLVAFLIALFIHSTEWFGLITMVGLTIFSFVNSNRRHKKLEVKKEEYSNLSKVVKKENEIDVLFGEYGSFSQMASANCISINRALYQEDLIELKNSKRLAKQLDSECNDLVYKTIKFVRKTETDSDVIDSCLARSLNSIQEISDFQMYNSIHSFEYIDNNHKTLVEIQINDLSEIDSDFLEYSDIVSNILKFKRFDLLDELSFKREQLKQKIKKSTKSQLKRLKKPTANIKRSMLFINIMSNLDTISEEQLNLCQSYQLISAEQLRVG